MTRMLLSWNLRIMMRDFETTVYGKKRIPSRDLGKVGRLASPESKVHGPRLSVTLRRRCDPSPRPP